MEIYKYFHDTKEWHNIVNAKYRNNEKREQAIGNFIKKYGTKVSIKEYFNDFQRKNGYTNYSYKCFGETENCLERLAKGEIDYDDDLSYCGLSERHPEDMVECRIDWNEMKSYADSLASFIDTLKNEIANGKIVLA